MNDFLTETADRFKSMPQPAQWLLGILAGVAATAIATIFLLMMGWWSNTSNTVERLEPRVAQILGFLESDLDIKVTLDERKRLLSEMALPSSGDSGRGGAVLQERVRSLSSQAGLTVIGSEVREPADLEDLIRLSVNAKLAGEPDALTSFFQSLVEQRPFLFVDSLSLTAQRNVARSRAGGASGQEANLLLDVEIYAYQEAPLP